MLKLIRQTYWLRSVPVESKRNSSCLALWNDDLSTEVKQQIENNWFQDILNKRRRYGNSHYYVLPMFPYPSGNLHMGHVRVYTISDTIARFQKLCGKNVIHPIGWDAFGLPAENAAIERKIAPSIWTKSNISSMKAQLLKLGIDFDWNREISTCDPEYYKWTQYIFLKLFELGLAYRNKGTVNWDPVDKTVLADEQIDEFGNSWRSGAKVEKRVLTQWFIKTTRYAKQLYDGLDSSVLDNWNDIINLQQHWIGECNGTVVTFKVEVGNNTQSFDVWTSEPYKFLHGEFLTMSKNNIVIQNLPESTRTLKTTNPITNKEMPIYITDDVQYPEGRDVYISCTKFDLKDNALARTLNVSSYTDMNVLKEIDLEKENDKAIHIARQKNVGGYYVSSKLKDWLISRQRFWGTPIPITHCEKCGTVPVPYNELPVKLPDCNSPQTGIKTLASISEWVNCKCPKCNSDAKRETDTMDTFVDSSWYYYRFLDPKNNDMPFDKVNLIDKTPVHIYIGGKEHAVLHLYYARFMSYFLKTLGLTPTEEPFKKLLVQGMVMGKTFKLKSTGKYLPPDTVEKVGKKYMEKNTKEPVLMEWEKMSKSKQNGESPERLLATLGCDTTRLLMLADVPPATNRLWSDATLPGVLNWQKRLWLTMREFLNHRNSQISSNSCENWQKLEYKIWQSRNYFIATTTYHFQYTHKISVGISRLQSLTSVLRNKLPPEIITKSKEFELALAHLIIMLSPITPHFCSELWAGLCSAPNRICNSSLIDWESNVLEQSWPKVDQSFELSFQCKVDGADLCDLKIAAHELEILNEGTAVKMMTEQEKVKKRISKGIRNTKFELYPGCRAILYIFTNRNEQKKIQRNV